MCFVCNCVTVVASVEQRVNSGKSTATGMPSNHSITADSWTLPMNIYECQDGPCKPESNSMNTNTDIWYDATDDLAVLSMKQDFKPWPVADDHKQLTSDSEDNSDNMQFYDAKDNLTSEDMECKSNGISEDHTPSPAEGVSCNGAASSKDNHKRTMSESSDFDWDDGFEFYFLSNGDCEDSDSDCESDDEDYEEECFTDDDDDFIIFEDSHRTVTKERTVSFKSFSPKSSYKCTDSKKPKKHVHFSPELVTVYVVTLGEEEGCRKSPWIQFAVDRMHFHHRIEQLERILTPCLLLKQKLGHRFPETMNCPKFVK